MLALLQAQGRQMAGFIPHAFAEMDVGQGNQAVQGRGDNR